MTEQEAWKIVRRFRANTVWDERNTVYELVKVIDFVMKEQEMADTKEQTDESKNM